LCTYYCRDRYALVARYGDEPLKGRAAFRDAGVHLADRALRLLDQPVVVLRHPGVGQGGARAPLPFVVTETALGPRHGPCSAVHAAWTTGIQAGSRSSPGRGAMNVAALQIQEVFQWIRLIADQILIGIRDKWGQGSCPPFFGAGLHD
jgi:hypothetical protein